MIRRLVPLSILVLVVLVAGCASARQGRDTREGSPPRVRCLTDAQRDSAEGTRPLFFFFCVESP